VPLRQPVACAPLWAEHWIEPMNCRKRRRINFRYGDNAVRAPGSCARAGVAQACRIVADRGDGEHHNDSLTTTSRSRQSTRRIGII
jgi:hypothetical protein